MFELARKESELKFSMACTTVQPIFASSIVAPMSSHFIEKQVLRDSL